MKNMLSCLQENVNGDPQSTTLENYNFHPLEVVSRFRNSQLQVGENNLYLLNLRRIFANLDLNTHYVSKKTVI